MTLGPVTVTSPNKIADRLLAHARLCRQIALQSAHESTRIELEQMAQECDRAAAQALHCDLPKSRLH